MATCRAIRLVPLVLLGLLLGCEPPGDVPAKSSPVVGDSREPAADVRTDPWNDEHQQLEWGPLSPEQAVAKTELGVLATVTAVGPVRWNSESGEKWAMRADSRATPLPYRDVTVRVDHVVVTGALPAQVGQSLVVRYLGDGTPTGPLVPTVPGLHINQAYGMGSRGDHLVLLLARNGFPLQAGRLEPRVEPVGGYRGVWLVEGPTARSTDPQATAPLADLLARLVALPRSGRGS